MAPDPVVIFTAVWPELVWAGSLQVSTGVPAFTVGARFTISNFVEVAFPHGAFPLTVNVNVIVAPAAFSAEVGVYVASVKEFELLMVPAPLDDHNTLK